MNSKTEAADTTQNRNLPFNKHVSGNLDNSFSSLDEEEKKDFENTKLEQPLGSKTEA